MGRGIGARATCPTRTARATMAFASRLSISSGGRGAVRPRIWFAIASAFCWSARRKHRFLKSLSCPSLSGISRSTMAGGDQAIPELGEEGAIASLAAVDDAQAPAEVPLQGLRKTFCAGGGVGGGDLGRS